jgi:hypothetical protein
MARIEATGCRIDLNRHRIYEQLKNEFLVQGKWKRFRPSWIMSGKTEHFGQLTPVQREALVSVGERERATRREKQS